MELSRRTFSALAGTTALGFALSGSGGETTQAYASHSVPTGPAPGAPAADRVRHKVGYDKYSLLVDGRRLVLRSGEMHPSGCRVRRCGGTSCRRCAPTASTR